MKKCSLTVSPLTKTVQDPSKRTEEPEPLFLPLKLLSSTQCSLLAKEPPMKSFIQTLLRLLALVEYSDEELDYQR